jgi:VWFA-related protein
MKRFALVLTLFALAFPTLAQPSTPAAQQPFQEQIDVNAVLLDIIVTDSKGNQILGLGKDDFIVKEDGVEQNVDAVDYFTNRRLLDQREENAPFKVEHVREDRYFVFFFDKPDAGVLFDEQNRARQAAVRFVREEMQPTDYVAVAGHDVRLKIYSDFTQDKKQLENAFTDAIKWGKGITKASASTDGPSLLRNMNTDDLINRTGTVYKALDFLADSVRPIRARKNLVMFSPGVIDRHETVSHGSITNRAPEFDLALQSLNASNVAVYAVQLQDGGNFASAIHQRLSELANETGGRYFLFNTSFEPAIERIEKANSGYYLLTYNSKKPKGEKGYQKVSVKVKNPEFKVVARGGYEFGS